MTGVPKPETSRVKFWEGMEADIDLGSIRRAAVPVKGTRCENPLRFLEIFSNSSIGKSVDNLTESSAWPWHQVRRLFLPRIPGVPFRLPDGSPQPPFAWRDASPDHLCVSFTYNTNAFLRILLMLSEEGHIPKSQVLPLLDQACVTLSSIYRARGSFLLRNINNNLNMFLISKTIEFLVGKHIYDSECQELGRTRTALMTALDVCREQQQLSLRDQMAISLGRGVSFMESRLRDGVLAKTDQLAVQDVAFSYFGRSLSIDHRDLFLSMIEDTGRRTGRCTLAVILDDAVESVDDLLWVSVLLDRAPFLHVNLLINTAQISINFSRHMTGDVLASPEFRDLASRLGTRVTLTEFYCPLISFQTNLLPPKAVQAINEADVVYIKGANFFETLQIPHKDTFYGFIVYGPISRAYTGLADFDAVFAHVPRGRSGYVHNQVPNLIVPLVKTCAGEITSDFG